MDWGYNSYFPMAGPGETGVGALAGGVLYGGIIAT